MFAEKFQIYGAQITGRYICESKSNHEPDQFIFN